MKTISFLLLAATLTGNAWAQTHQPYAGEQRRTIKALSEREIDDLLSGRGAGLARAAELNSYPGPMHVLEHADALRLTPAQRSATEALIAPMRAAAQKHGAELVAAERELDRLFAEGRVTPEALTAQLQTIGAAQARVRQAHLETHIAQRALLRPEQIASYNRLRGYHDRSNAGSSAEPAHDAVRKQHRH